jgi:hypothetical protein
VNPTRSQNSTVTTRRLRRQIEKAHRRLIENPVSPFERADPEEAHRALWPGHPQMESRRERRGETRPIQDVVGVLSGA